MSEIRRRGPNASTAINNTSFKVCSGSSPSAPGSPPGVVTGNYRSGFRPNTENTGSGVICKSENDVFYGPFLEDGHAQQPGRFVPTIGKRLVADHVSARPHVDRIQQEALPKVEAIFAEPYNV